MSKKPKLSKRFYEYIQNVYLKDKTRLVSRNILFDLAQAKSYTKTEIWEAIRKIEEELQIAVLSDYGQIYYRYLNLPYEEIKKKKADLKWFDNLPE